MSERVDVAIPYCKIGILVDSAVRALVYDNAFCAQDATDASRLAVASTEPWKLVTQWSALLEPPFGVLLVLHSPRRSEAEGRYESPPLDRSELSAFLNRFCEAFQHDGRADLWLRSHATGDMIIFDKHNLLYAYGSIDLKRSELLGCGYAECAIELPFPHTHYFHPSLDDDFDAMLEWFPWQRTPLLPGDDE